MFDLLVISSPSAVDNEISLICQLFEHGLKTFHVRKQEMSKEDMRSFLKSIPSKYHSNIMLHQYYDLVKEYDLKGIHLTEKAKKEMDFGLLRNEMKEKLISVAFHALEDLRSDERSFDYVLLSPVFDSISKQDYSSGFDINILRSFLSTIQFRPEIYALGGVSSQNINLVRKVGFDGAALLGSIWKSEDPIQAFCDIKNSNLI